MEGRGNASRTTLPTPSSPGPGPGRLPSCPAPPPGAVFDPPKTGERATSATSRTASRPPGLTPQPHPTLLHTHRQKPEEQEGSKEDSEAEVKKAHEMAAYMKRGHRRSIAGSLDLGMPMNVEREHSGLMAGQVPHHSEYQEKSFNLETLKLLKVAFDRADTDGSGELEEDEFIEAFQSVEALTAHYQTTEQLRHLFMKIDANSDGSVDWDEFTNHILLEQSHQMMTADDAEQNMVKYQDLSLEEKKENEEKGAKKKIMTSEERLRFKHEQHRDMIEDIKWIPQIKGYLSAGRDGALKVWNETNQFQRTIRNGSGWITDMSFMSPQPLAVASMERTITFYDANRPSLDALCKIKDLDNVPMCVEYARVSDRDMLFYGDDRGAVHAYSLEEEWGGETSSGSGSALEVGSKKLPGMNIMPALHIHADWVTKLYMLAESTSLSFISSSMDSSLKFVDMEKRKVKWTVHGHSRGVSDFDVCKSFNFVASCGVERKIMLWNPFTGRSLGSLQGHNASVQRVIVNEDDNQLISLSTDKVLKIWDIRTNKCIQTIQDETDYWPENRISSIMYNPYKETIVTGAVRPKLWNKQRKVTTTTKGPEHDICTALYNPHFRQIVTGDLKGTIVVYNLEDGLEVFQFNDTHDKAPLSAMAFDNTGRRLLTAAQDGSLKMWNFNNGQCLKEFEAFGASEIACATYIEEGPNRFIAAAGWNREVCIWEDDPQYHVALRHRMVGHKDDINCMCLCPITSFAVVLASGSYDGRVILWKLDGIIKATLAPPDLAATPPDDRAFVKLLFLPHVFGAVMGLRVDGKLFCWRLIDNTLVYTLDTAHEGKTVRAVAVNESNSLMLTADSSGYLKVWGIQKADEGGHGRAPTVDMQEALCWRAHDAAVIAVEYIEIGSFILSASVDEVRLWTGEGAHIGTFGQESEWQLRLWSTYANPDPEYFERRDADGEESEAYDEADFASDSEEDDEVLNDRIWLDQQKALIAQKGGRFRKKKASRFADVLQRRLPIQELAAIDAPQFEKRSDAT